MISIGLSNHKNKKTHAKDIMRNILKYSPEIFQHFSLQTQIHYAREAIASKKYYELKHILNLNPNVSIIHQMLYKAVEFLDKKAILLITDYIINSEDKSIKDSYFIDRCLISNIYNRSEFEDIDPILQKDIHILLLKAKPSEDINAEDMQTLSYHISKNEFDEFCQSKNITITDEKFKNLDLARYNYENVAPVKLIDSNNSQPYLVDILLNSSYSDSMSADSIKAIYNKIFSLGPIAQEMLTYIAVLISNGNPIKIIFEAGTLSFYSPLAKLVKINSNFANEPIFNIESVTIHEFMHFFMINYLEIPPNQ